MHRQYITAVPIAIVGTAPVAKKKARTLSEVFRDMTAWPRAIRYISSANKNKNPTLRLEGVFFITVKVR